MMMMLSRRTRGMLSSGLPSSFDNLTALFHSKFGDNQVLRDPPTISNVEQTLNMFDKMLHMRPVACFSQLLARIARLERYDVVIPLFKQMGVMGIAPDASTLNVVTNCYCHLKHAPGLGLPVLPHFFKLGLQLDITTFTALINSFLLQTTVHPKTSNAKLNYLDYALNMFHEMLRSRPLPSVISFTKILGQLVKLKHYFAVIPLFQQMRLLIAPNHYTLSIIINCYCHLNQMGFSLSILGSFFKSGLEPDVITFNTLIHGFILDNQVAEAARIFTKTLEAGHCKPDVSTFNILLKGFCKTSNSSSAAIQLLRKMEEVGCKPNTISYGTIIDSLCKDLLVDEALELFKEMISRGIAPNVVTYTCLIQGLCNVGQWQEATRLLDQMLSKGVSPDIFTFSVLVDTLCKQGMVIKAKTVVQMMIQRGIEPNTVTYSSLMDGYCMLGEMDKAKEVFDLMINKGGMVNVHSCSILINGYCKAKKIDQATKIFIVWKLFLIP
ncbi:hypothetical protein ACLB2K_021520 [Fragaria x ananassa]